MKTNLKIQNLKHFKIYFQQQNTLWEIIEGNCSIYTFYNYFLVNKVASTSVLITTNKQKIAQFHR